MTARPDVRVPGLRKSYEDVVSVSAIDLVAVFNENFLASFRKVVEHSPDGEVRWFGRVFAFVTGLPLSLFNGCVVLEPTFTESMPARANA